MTVTPSLLTDRLREFLFPAKSDRWLAALRLGLAFSIISYAWSLRNDWNYLLGDDAGSLVSRHVAEAILSLDTSFVPRIGWLKTAGSQLGLPEGILLTAVWICLLGAGCALLLGLFCRTAAVTAWLLHLCAAKSGGLVAYGVDNLMTIGLFYLMLSPLPDSYSLDHQWRKRLLKARHWLGFFRRILQLHLCLIYFFGGLAKSLGSGWWNGANIWRALTRAPFNVVSPDVLVQWKYILPVLGISICVVEIFYPLFMGWKKTRPFWLGCVLAMHLMIGLTMGMYLFAFVMLVLNLAAFGPDFSTPETKVALPPA